MADYIYMMETRLSPEQQRAVSMGTDIARAHGMNVYLTGGAMRDMVSGFTIRDLDFTVEGNPLKLERDLEKNVIAIQGRDEDLRSVLLQFPGNVRAEIHMARSERYAKPGRAPEIASATIIEDLRRRDFTVNAIALSLNPGSRGLLLDPTNGLADIEAKLIRILHNYSFLEDPSRLIRATRFLARFHWTMDERTQGRYNAAKENNYIENITDRARGYEIEQLAYEDEPMAIMRALEREDWLKVLHPHWNPNKVDTAGLAQLMKTRQQMVEMGYNVDPAAAVLYFLTARMNERDTTEMQKLIPRKGLVEAWRNVEQEAKQLAKLLTSKEAATPSRTWKLLSSSRPETILFLETTSRQQAVTQKIRNFFGKWRQVKQRFPLAEMAELRITPELPVYPKLTEDMFYLMLDGKLRSSREIIKFLKPHSPPPPPPPPPPPKKGRAAKAAAPVPAAAPVEPKARGRKKKGAPTPAPAVATAPSVVANPPAPKGEAKKPAKTEGKTPVPAAAQQQAPAKAATKASIPLGRGKNGTPSKRALPTKKTVAKKKR
jgi:tRNA nucleotidyltransferase (CCA-adding enzyme)